VLLGCQLLTDGVCDDVLDVVEGIASETVMANAQKPTPHTRHMDIKYFALRDWVEQDLICLERIDMKINLAGPFTKVLQCASFHCHVDFI
jgi:hypothetical protein